MDPPRKTINLIFVGVSQRGTRTETVKLDEIEAVCNVTAKT
jgi:hypothetical protein